jgi:Kef-type K+ transport system membrane component KefB
MLLSVLLALTVIMMTARVVGLVFSKLNQPAVIGEVVGGILLGPSVLGHFAPDLQSLLLPQVAMPVISAIAQIGVILYMFLVGIELDVERVRHSMSRTVWIAIASIVVPFAIGAALAASLYESLSPASVPMSSFVMFFGVALAITAFPVLARILEDRALQKTPLGTMALTCAAIDDAMAWGLLAFIVTVIPSTPQTPMGTLKFIAVHSIFGAFLLGAIVPHRNRIATLLTGRISSVVKLLFLPPFFAMNGLRTQIGLVDTPRDWLLCALIITAATAGKWGGTTIAARATGMPWRDSSALGILMNTRGLVELIVLNIGLDLGLVTPRLFTMLVVMALVTTMMTSPVLARLMLPFNRN